MQVCHRMENSKIFTISLWWVIQAEFIIPVFAYLNIRVSTDDQIDVFGNVLVEVDCVRFNTGISKKRLLLCRGCH